MLFVRRVSCGLQGLFRKHSQELQSNPVSPYISTMYILRQTANKNKGDQSNRRNNVLIQIIS